MLNAIVVSIRFIVLILSGQKQLALENADLRQHLAGQTQRSAAKTEQLRSIIFGSACT